ncbi:DUF3108 domain-containing protein [Rhodomicrobium sp. Az07]|uniref:DUF3108 domain-containing protein n=1 Tax=Rhodomicrobium sp. Az07 TaxID=2839034 RepID=UPI001BE81CDC|nr:DUF3108 domain-containing protein [Rhodomicrobium sp. Az07]MBT3070867.1 DUF3108 domain-containing protein [Rhodomicrobium sp. Az07]
MAKRPLLGSDWANPAAVLFLLLVLFAFVSIARARAQETPQGGVAASDAPSEKKAEEKKPAVPQLSEKPEAPQPAEKKAEVATDAKPEAKPEAEKPHAKAVEAPEAKRPPQASASGNGKAGDNKSPGEAREARPAEKAADKAPAERERATEKAVEQPKNLTPPIQGGNGALAVRSSKINALYRIHWIGAHIGDFRIRSSITNRQYSLQADADISVLFGSVSWRGVTSSSGLMTANGPVPQSYMFRYQTGNRGETVKLLFQQKMVRDILINPPARPGARNAPITAAHLQNVVDPLSALVLLSQARLAKNTGEGACNKRLPIFDGKIRYDLVLSPKGKRSVAGAGKLRGTAFVCNVRYVPIAGYKLGKPGESDYATGNTGIEVWLVPLPEAGLIVPYYVHVPTPAGTASLVTTTFHVETAGGRHALAE